MISTLKSIVCTVWSKIRSPSIKALGIHSVGIGTEIKVKRGGTLTIGKRVSTRKRVVFSAIGGNLVIGESTSFNRNDIIVCHNHISIGKNCAFGPNVVIYDHDHKFDINGFSRTVYNSSPVIIEDNCWVCSNVIILRGSHIGEGSIIGAGCIIKGKIPAHSVVRSTSGIDIVAMHNFGGTE